MHQRCFPSQKPASMDWPAARLPAPCRAAPAFPPSQRQESPCNLVARAMKAQLRASRRITVACSITAQPIKAAAATDPSLAQSEQRSEQVRHAAANALLQVLDPEGGHRAVAAQQLLGAAGLGLVALREAAPGETLLRVPLPLVLQTCGGSEDSSGGEDAEPWTATMATILLRVAAAAAGSQSLDFDPADAQAASAAAAGRAPQSAHPPSGALPTNESKGSSSQHTDRQLLAWRHWVAALPGRMPLPWACWDGDVGLALRKLGDEDMALEASALQSLMQDSWPEDTGVSQAAWMLACSLVVSRSFRDGNHHLVVPGVDLANHSFSPTASVRGVRDPDNCQGAAASAEVCGGASAAAAEGFIELLAGEDGLNKGNEVTISYGPWPGDVWALFYGFVPQPNPHDRVMLFSDLEHLADFAAQQFGPSGVLQGGSASAGAQLLQHLTSGLGGEYQRLFMTAEGFDERLTMAAQRLVSMNCPLRLAWPAARMTRGSAPDRPLQPGDILAARMAQMLQAADGASPEALFAAARAADGREAVLQCIAHRRKVLAAGVSALWGANASPK